MDKLRIYNSSVDLVVEVYSLIRKNKGLNSDWSLSDQLRRASVSVPANIAEGYLRTKKQFKNYLRIASGSANEVVALLHIINKVYKIDTLVLQESFKVLAKQISAFSNKLLG